MGVEFLVGLGLAAVGTGLGVAGSVKSQNAMNDQTQKALDAEAGYQSRANKVYDTSVAQSTPQVAREQKAAGENQAMQGYQQAQAAPLSVAPTNPVDAGTALRTQAIVGQGNDARARVVGQNNWSLEQSLKNLVAQEQLGVINTEASARAGVLPLQLQQASHAGDALGLAGTGVSALGSLAALHSMYGGFASGAKPLPPITNPASYVDPGDFGGVAGQV